MGSDDEKSEKYSFQIEFNVKKRQQLYSELQKTFDASSKVAPGTVSHFLSRCDDLSRLKEKFEVVQDNLLSLNLRLDADEQIEIEKVNDSFDELYYKTRTMENDLRARMTIIQPGQVSQPSLEMRLPKIELPSWSGDQYTFPNFWAMFNSMVHKGKFADAIKFTYLRSALSGTPLTLIEHLDLSDKNYLTAYNLINDRYGNVRTLATCYINKMLEFAPLKSCTQKDLQLFLDTFFTTHQALNNLSLPDGNDFILFQLASRALPIQLRLRFERTLGSRTSIPTFDQLIEFVEEQCKIEELAHVSAPLKPTPNTSKSDMKGKSSTNKFARYPQSLLVSTPTSPPSVSTTSPPPVSTTSPPPVSTSNSTISLPNCVICKNQCSRIYFCPAYSKLSLSDKYDKLKELRRCFKCLGSHLRSHCSSTGRCKYCHSSSHHSSLHAEKDKIETLHKAHPTASTLSSTEKTPPVASLFTVPTVPKTTRTVLLGTAQALIRNKFGKLEPIRLVIDGGSQVCLISSECAQRLSLPIIKKETNISGALAQKVGTSRGVVSCTLFPRSSRSLPLASEAVIVKNVCADLPTIPIPDDVYQRFKHLNLADQTFHERGKIDFLLGASLYPSILRNNSNILHGEPAALETVFGFVIMGNVSYELSPPLCEISLFMCNDDVNTTLKSFWEIEEGAPHAKVDPVHTHAEQHFLTSHSRRADGSYVVRLPFIPAIEHSFGDSETIARRRWFNLESKLRKNPELRSAYHAFMSEYRNLGHMTLTKEPGLFYLPHFAITRASSSSPVRVVFDGSCKDSSGSSLNDHLLVGPPLQKDICDVISFFRFQPIALTTDIKMMYRGIWLHPDDTRYQHVLWRVCEDDPLESYALQTVTYGLTCAPFLAQRVLQQLVRDEGHKFPRAAPVILSSCYMDDICSSASSIDEALALRDELIAIMKLGGFELRKWASNSSELLDDIPVEHRVASLSLQSSESCSLHILGLVWIPSSDIFTYSVKIVPKATTKRQVLSQIASIFDPLGWITPVVFRAKLLLREIWECNLDWDSSLPYHIQSRWAAFSAQLPQLSKVAFPRLLFEPALLNRTVLGFCDASTQGYAAAIYLRSCSANGQVVSVRLLRAKSRVAPLKVLTVPRLELNGALLLSKLLHSVQPLMERVEVTGTYLFSDSSVVLAWLRTPPHHLQTYVANRIVSILEITEVNQWHHISTSSNAADVASRGLFPEEIVSHSTWWTGPSFLYHPPHDWPIRQEFIIDANLPELKRNAQVMLATPKIKVPTLVISIINRYSSLNRLKRVMAWILRFINNCKHHGVRKSGPLAPSELYCGMLACIRATQQYYFESELSTLSKENQLPPYIARLSPFLKNGLMRVGGRLSESLLPIDAKHPFLLPKLCHLSSLICNAFHLKLLHAGPQACQAAICQEFWIISLRSLLRQCIFRCMPCYRHRLRPEHPIMADLPSSRVTPSPPFEKTAVDYAGPILIRASTLRNSPKLKAYICIFVCMATKAVHIELSSDLSSECFLGALNRFVARRGLCKDIFCDNGTNFRGAQNESSCILQSLRSSYPHIADYLATKDICYHFNPPSSPWMGGLWESAVKATKRHLHDLSLRVLTYEELSTLLARIEAILNSRPLCPLGVSSDSLYLTPGHFLVGRPLLSPLEHDLSNLPLNHLSRWQHVQQASQRFWKMWTSHYLHTLMARQKWTTPRPPLCVGDVVIILRSQSRPMDWPLGRITELHLGRDGVARSASVQTAQGQFVRPVARLAPLPPTEPVQ